MKLIIATQLLEAVDTKSDDTIKNHLEWNIEDAKDFEELLSIYQKSQFEFSY